MEDNTNNPLSGANLKEIATNATAEQQTGSANQTLDSGSGDTKPVLPKDDDYLVTPDNNGGLTVTPTSTVDNGAGAPASTYEGNGFVVEKKQGDQAPASPQQPPIVPNNPDFNKNIAEYMSDYDQRIQDQHQLAQQIKSQQAAEDDEQKEIDPEEAEEKLNENYSQAIVIIDKSGMGQIINFTDEEREKLERAKKITLQETETVELKTIKTKKPKKTSLGDILKRQPSVLTTPIINPASAYTAVVKGCSTYELIALMGGSNNRLIDTTTKWTLIFNKIESSSLGKFSEFNDFLKATAAIDYNNFIYALLCSTYPDDDKIPLKCPKCGKEFDHHYSVRSLIRAEKMTDGMKVRVKNIVDASHTTEDAKRIHEESGVNTTKRIKLPLSGYVFDLHIQSAYDLINNSIKGLQENKDPNLEQAAALSTVVRTVYIPDPEAEGEYFEYDQALDITKVIYSLQDKDILMLTKQADALMEGLEFEYGLMNVTCPHCKNYRDTVPFDIETILFYRYQQAMSTKID